MKVFWSLLFLFIGNLSQTLADDQQVMQEIQISLDQLEIIDAMLRMGLNNPNLGYAQAVHAQHVKDAFLANSNLLTSPTFNQDWFQLDIAQTPNHSDILQEYLGLMNLTEKLDGNPANWKNSEALLTILRKKFPNTPEGEVSKWIEAQIKMWQAKVLEFLRSSNPEERTKGIDYALRFPRNNNYLNGFSSKIFGDLADAEKLRIVKDLLNLPDLTEKTLYLPWFLENIAWKVWLQNQGLLQTLLENASHRYESSQGIIDFLAKNETIARSKVSLTPIYDHLSTQSQFFYYGQAFTLIEQLFLLSESYREKIFSDFISPQNKSWSFDLIDLYFSENLLGSRQLAPLLLRSYIVQDSRWFQWLIQIDKDSLSYMKERLIKIDKFFTSKFDSQSEADKMFEVQKQVFTYLEDMKFRDASTLILFIKGATQNPRLRQEIINHWGDKIIILNQPNVTLSFVQIFFFHQEVDYNTRMHWLELIIKMGNNTVETLTTLANWIGLEESLRQDLARTDISEEIKVELLRDSLIGSLIRDSQRKPSYRCQAIFN